MSGKSVSSTEFDQWMKNVGLSGPLQSGLMYDEIPGFVNSNVFGHFSLDDLDFGDDLTKGRIDFDDESLLLSPPPGSEIRSESGGAYEQKSPVKDDHHVYSESYSVRDNYPKKESSGSYYHPPYSTQKSAERAVKEEKHDSGQGTYLAAVRQMPKDGKSVQDNVFEGMEGMARELKIDSKFIDSAKSFLDKAPTRRKLREEEKKAARRSVNTKKGGTGASIRLFAVFVIMLLLVRFISSLYQATASHVETSSPTGGTLINGGRKDENEVPAEMYDAWHAVYDALEQWRLDNSDFPLMEMSCEETRDFLEEAGWQNVTITEEDDVRGVEAYYGQENSTAAVSVDSETMALSFSWSSAGGMPEEEIEAAWENLLPADAEIYPGMPVDSTMISDEMLQTIRDYGTQDTYGSIEESYLSADDLFISLFEYKDSGWDLYISGDATDIQIHTDNTNEYVYSIVVEGETNLRFQ